MFLIDDCKVNRLIPALPNWEAYYLPGETLHGKTAKQLRELTDEEYEGLAASLVSRDVAMWAVIVGEDGDHAIMPVTSMTLSYHGVATGREVDGMLHPPMLLSGSDSDESVLVCVNGPTEDYDSDDFEPLLRMIVRSMANARESMELADSAQAEIEAEIDQMKLLTLPRK